MKTRGCMLAVWIMALTFGTAPAGAKEPPAPPPGPVGKPIGMEYLLCGEDRAGRRLVGVLALKDLGGGSYALRYAVRAEEGRCAAGQGLATLDPSGVLRYVIDAGVELRIMDPGALTITVLKLHVPPPTYQRGGSGWEWVQGVPVEQARLRGQAIASGTGDALQPDPAGQGPADAAELPAREGGMAGPADGKFQLCLRGEHVEHGPFEERVTVAPLVGGRLSVLRMVRYASGRMETLHGEGGRTGSLICVTLTSRGGFARALDEGEAERFRYALRLLEQGAATSRLEDAGGTPLATAATCPRPPRLDPPPGPGGQPELPSGRVHSNTPPREMNRDLLEPTAPDAPESANAGETRWGQLLDWLRGLSLDLWAWF